VSDPGATSYYGRPVIKPPVWKPEIGFYLFTGGVAGASAPLALAARASGNPRLARTAILVGTAAVTVSPALLVKDLGRPERFWNMLRVFKPTSPMSVGSWILAASGATQSLAAACELAGVLPRTRTAAQAASAALGPALATYTAVLISDTAVPVWHEARRTLPPIFAASACSSAGAACVLVGPAADTGPARRLALLGAAGELAGVRAMERRLGKLGEPYRHGRAGRYGRAAKLLTAVGAAGMAARRPGVRRLAAGSLLAGALFERFSIFAAGDASARDPRHTVAPQRERVDARAG
jgi:Polysulphide reductase, NrfD